MRDGSITPVPGTFATTGDFLRQNPFEDLGRLKRRAGRRRGQAAVSGDPNQQFLCQGANYRQHMIESGMDPDAKTFNMIFTKARVAWRRRTAT